MSVPPRGRSRPVRSALEAVAIAEVEVSREEVAGRYFATEEYAAIAGRRAQTTAGFLAAKRALVRLFSEGEPGRAFSERDFVLAHRSSGAPRLASWPDGLPTSPIRVSISHTREVAYGLAVVEGEAGG